MTLIRTCAKSLIQSADALAVLPPLTPSSAPASPTPSLGLRLNVFREAPLGDAREDPQEGGHLPRVRLALIEEDRRCSTPPCAASSIPSATASARCSPGSASVPTPSPSPASSSAPAHGQPSPSSI